MKILTHLLRTHRGTFLLAVALGLTSGACSARLLALINSALATPGAPDRGLILPFVLFGLATLIARASSQVLLNRLHHHTVYALRMRLSRQILASPLRRLEQAGMPRLLNLLQDDVFVVGQGLVQLPSLLINAATVIGCLAYLAYLSGAVFAALVVVLALGVVLCSIPLRAARGLIQHARDRLDVLFGHLQSLVTGIKELKLHARRRAAFEAELLEPTAAESRDLLARSSNVNLIAVSTGSLLLFVLIGLLLFAFPAIATVSHATAVGYTVVVLYLQQPLDNLLAMSHMLSRSSVALKKMEALGLSLEEHGERSAALARAEPRSFERIDLVGVTHAYHREDEDSHFAIGPIDLSLQRGEVLFLIGGNGSGKTTLAKLLTGLYVPEAGEVRLNGEVVGEAQREHYRQHFSTVFSDFHLFERLLGVSAPEQLPRVQGFLARLQLERKVKVDAGVLSTTQLSQGQRKRLALLTAYLEDRPVYLFDEWAADQDPAFKEVFYRELVPELKRAGKAVVVISHDDRYFGLADRIVRLEFGKRVDSEAPVAVAQRAS